jgi:hypothetical protein
MKVSTENDNNFGYDKITIVVDNIPLKSLLHSGLKQVMSLFTLGSARAVLVVALVYSFPVVFNVIMALISPYTNQPFIVPIRQTSIVS